MYSNIYAIPFVEAGLIMLILALMIRKFTYKQGVKYFAILIPAGAVCSVFYAPEISSQNPGLIKTFHKLGYLGITFISQSLQTNYFIYFKP